MKKWLEKVETAIQSRKSIQEEAVSTLKSVDYSVKAIAAEIGASRTTIYNHEQLLKRYIEQSTINDWDILKVTTFSWMFYDCPSHPTFTKRAGTWNSDGTFTPTS